MTQETETGTKPASKTPYYSKSKASWGFIKGVLPLPNVIHPDVFRWMSGAPLDGFWVGYRTAEAAVEALKKAEERICKR